MKLKTYNLKPNTEKKFHVPSYKFQERGVSLIITFFIMIIILAVAFSVTSLLYGQVKIIRNIGNSIVSIYAADSGIEKVLYYDRIIFPHIEIEGGEEGEMAEIARGLCTMYLYHPFYNYQACIDPENNEDVEVADDSMYCLDAIDPEAGIGSQDGCDPTVCDNCKISFYAEYNGIKHYVTAFVKPSVDGQSSNFEIESRGVYGSSERLIKVSISKIKSEEAIIVKNACVNEKSVKQGDPIEISADIRTADPSNTIGLVKATIKDSNMNVVPGGDGLLLQCEGGGCFSNGAWSTTWIGDIVQQYYVDLYIEDTMNPKNTKTLYNILPIPLCYTN